MELRQLEYFVTCARLGSLTLAADALYTTQPHVSMVIRSLEEELGTALFRRRSRGVELTDEGARVFIYAKKTLKNADMVRQAGSAKEGRWLSIASNPSSYMACVLADLYDTLRAEGTLLRYTECGIEEMMELMAHGGCDIGFVFAPTDRRFALNTMAEHRRLEYSELFRSGLVLHVSEKHPCWERSSIRPEDLEQFDFIQTDEDFFTVEELLGSEWRSPLHRVISTNSDHLMIAMLQSGRVCNLGSYWLREKFRQYNFRMIPIEGYEEKISFGFLRPKGENLNPEAERFLRHLTENVLGEPKPEE